MTAEFAKPFPLMRRKGIDMTVRKIAAALTAAVIFLSALMNTSAENSKALTDPNGSASGAAQA